MSLVEKLQEYWNRERFRRTSSGAGQEYIEIPHIYAIRIRLFEKKSGVHAEARNYPIRPAWGVSKKKGILRSLGSSHQRRRAASCHILGTNGKMPPLPTAFRNNLG
jgi:hypothetical protein